MKGRVTLLGGLLAAQVLLAALVLLAGGDDEAVEWPWFSFERSAVTAIHIDDGERSLALQRSDDGWLINGALPAAATEVDALLDELADVEAGWPVATTAAGRERFEVADDSFQRRITVEADGASVAELVTGTSPGFGRVHARRGDDDAVYSIDLAQHRLATDADPWLDRTLLQPAGDVLAVERAGHWRLEWQDDGWQLDGTPVAGEAVGALIDSLASLRVAGIEDGDTIEATAVLQVRTAEGTSTLTLAAPEDTGLWRVRSDRHDAVFGLPARFGEALAVDADALRGAVDDDSAAGDPDAG